jgi:hypothetical protein
MSADERRLIDVCFAFDMITLSVALNISKNVNRLGGKNIIENREL